jgi:hypothetical protein
MKGIIFYTDNLIWEPIKSAVEKTILASGLPVVSCSLKPLDFGKNIVLDLEPSFITYMTQIKTALENSDSDYVFFCEHDCLYPKSHFDFTPLRDDIYYYNKNSWRWMFGSDFAITYDELMSLSGLCCNRKLALDQYTRRIAKAITKPPEANIREPSWARAWGMEPGTKKPRNGGFSELQFETWRSGFPIVDIRHKGTITRNKVTLDEFKHLPVNWQQIPVKNVPGWDIISLFNL